MFSQVQLIIGGVVLAIIGIMGVTIHFQDKQITTCKSNTKLQKELHKQAIKSYEEAIDSISEYYDIKLSDVDSFERKENETDCQASHRFFNNANY